MNNASNEKEPLNMWERREELPHVAGKHTILATAVCFLCALGLPLCFANEWVALVLLAVLFIYVAIAIRSPISVTMILVATVICTMLGGFSIGAVFLALAVGTMTGAFLFTASRLPYLTVLLPVAAACLEFAFVSDLRVALLSLAFLPAAILLALATLKGAERTMAICFAEAGLVLVVLAVILVVICDAMGGLGRDAILTYIGNLRGELVNAVITVRDEVLALANAGADAQTKAAYDQMMAMLSNEMIADTVAQVFNLLPAIVLVICSIIAFFAQSMLNSAYYAVGLKDVLTPNARYFTMSVTAAVIYTLTFLLMIFVPYSSMVGAVVQNLCLILMPGLCILGVQGLLVSLTRSRGGMRIFMVILIASMLCCYTSGALYILAMWGAYDRVLFAIRKRMIEKLTQEGRNGSNGDVDGN